MNRPLEIDDPGSLGFLCGTRRIVYDGKRCGFRVVCATCGAGGSRCHGDRSEAIRACMRDSGRACKKCGAE
jgi:hypothetical protein